MPFERNQERSQGAATPPAASKARAFLPWIGLLSVPVAAVAAMLAEGAAAAWMIGAGCAALAYCATAFGMPAGAAVDDDDDEEGDGGVRSAARNSAVHGGSLAAAAAKDVLLRAIEVRSTERTAILDAIADGVILVDLHGETRFANKAAGAMLGENATVAGTRDAIGALPPQVLRAVQAVVEAGGTERRRLEAELRDHASTPVVIHVSVVRGHSESLAAIMVRDVRSEREADRMKSEFVAKASHELRTPLASPRAYAELLADGEVGDDAQRREFAGIILSETNRLGALVDRMLDIGRIESGMARATLEQVDFGELGRQCVEEQQGEANRRMIALKLSRAERAAVAQADRPLMKQVILNLLSNALKYTPDGGEVSLEIDTDNLARAVVVSVKDNGLGIPEHALPRLFGKFYRVENHERIAKGTGLGLNLCRNIVEAMHGGQIGVDSKVGVGSRFWFAIPMDQSARDQTARKAA
ncbi:MAG: PAS domain-containing protein [Phycisphaera sp.]|nr:PAS domain-containing protein [Phycisphaera sp.]